jgi:uracil-DNA glycosylase family 4
MAKKIVAEGPQDARIMIVGEAPGKQEESFGRPFVGGAGQLLRDELRAAGIDERKVFFTNLTKHRPPGNDLWEFFNPKTGTPDDPRLFEGLMELREEINAVQPNVIVACGNYPLAMLTGRGSWNKSKDPDKRGYRGIGDWRGSILEGVRFAAGRKVVAAFHPAGVLRNYRTKPTLTLDLIRAKEQSAFPEIRRPQKKIVIDPQGEERMEIRDRLLNHGSFITFDIEQLGSNLMCVGMTSDKDESYVFRIRSGSDIRFVRDLLESGKPLCAQNAMFDLSMLEYWFKIKVIERIKHDTMLASHSAYIEQPKDLGFLCSIYTEQPCYWTNVNWKSISKDLAMGKTDQIDSVDFLTYNAIDAWVTHDVMEQQLADELQDPNVKATFDFEMSLMAPLWRMSKRGMLVSRERMDSIQMSCATKVKTLGLELNEILGYELNVASHPAVGKMLYVEQKMPIVKMTKSKTNPKPSGDDFALSMLELKLRKIGGPKHRIVQLIREIRKNRSLISKFVNIEYDKDGRMRCHYKIGGTVTGRLSSQKFFPTGTGANLQNIPRDKRVRSVFVPDDGHVFFYNDLERAESLVVAKLTGDPLMLEHHKPGADAHKLLAAELFEEELDDITDEMRYMGKQTRHAGNYMEGPKVFMNNVNKLASITGVSITFEEAKYFIQRYRDLHPYLTRWWNDTAFELRTKRKLYNLAPHRRMRHFYDRVESCLPQAIAYVPQSTVGDALNYAIVACDADEELRDYGVQLLVQVHDAIGGQVPEKYVEPAMARMRKLMAIDITVPTTGEVFQIPVEIAFGPSWGEVKKWEGDLVEAA